MPHSGDPLKGDASGTGVFSRPDTTVSSRRPSKYDYHCGYTKESKLPFVGMLYNEKMHRVVDADKHKGGSLS